MKDYEIFDVIKSLNFKTDDYESAKRKIAVARNESGYTIDQKKIFNDFLKDEKKI